MSGQVRCGASPFGDETIVAASGLLRDGRMSPHRYALIATTERATGETLSCLVTARGLETVVLRDGDAAVALLRERGVPALTIVDLALPRVDGFGVIRALRALAPAATAPVVAVSSNLALRTRAMDLRHSLGIGAVLSMQLTVPRIDQLITQLFTCVVPSVTTGLWTSPTQPPVTEEAPAADPAREVARERERDLRQLVMNASPSPVLQAQVSALARLFGVSSVLVSLVTRDRQFFKAYHGIVGQLLAERGTPSDLAVCRHVVEDDRPAALIVPNAFESPEFASHPLVVSGLIGSFVGVPIVSPTGMVLGTLCVIDEGMWLGSAQMVDALQIEARAVAMVLCGERLRARQLARGSQAVPVSPAVPVCRMIPRPAVARRSTRPNAVHSPLARPA